MAKGKHLLTWGYTWAMRLSMNEYTKKGLTGENGRVICYSCKLKTIFIDSYSYSLVMVIV